MIRIELLLLWVDDWVVYGCGTFVIYVIIVE